MDRLGLASESAGWDFADRRGRRVSRQSMVVPLLHWPEDPAQSLDLFRALEARLADGHRLRNKQRPYNKELPNINAPRAARLMLIGVEVMPLLLTGRGFRRDLEECGCVAMHVPLEGGAETRLLRRLRAAGYRTHLTSARGLGDPEIYLLRKHGFRPPHLGHQSVGRGAAVGEVQQVMPQLFDFALDDSPVVLWLLEGQVLSRSELLTLCDLTNREPRLRVVVEMGGARSLRWQPMRELLKA